MPETTQFCVGLTNKPGELAGLCEAMRQAHVNIEALFVSDDTDGVWVNLVTSPVDKAERVLTEKGYRFVTERVVAVEVGNKPGELGRVASELAAADININYVYGAGAAGNPCLLVLGVGDPARAAEILKG